MSSTTEKLLEALRNFEESDAHDGDFVRLRDFYIDMQQKGLIIKKTYDLPLIDTIGRTAYRTNP